MGKKTSSRLHRDSLVVIVEHQSTLNENMPLRMLEYVARIYGKLVGSKCKFLEKHIPLPKPEFIVFYTGNKFCPAEKYLYLSDAFPTTTKEESHLELKR